MKTLSAEIYDVDQIEALINKSDQISGDLGNFFGYNEGPAAPVNYVHKQGMASAEWTVMHNLNKYCSVVVVDSTNQIVFPEIVYVDKNTVKVISTGAFSGQAYCN